MIAGIIGKLGRGKTLLMSILAYLTFKKGSFYVRQLIFPEIFSLSNSKIIYSNYFLKFPFTPIHDAESLENMKEGSAFLDEFWLWVDSRMSMSKRNVAINNMALTSRKRNLDIFYTSQSWGKIDKRIRQITDVLLVPNYNMNTGTIAVDVIEPLQNAYVVIKTFRLPAKCFFNLYDTKQEIDDLENNKETDVLEKQRDSDYTNKRFKKPDNRHNGSHNNKKKQHENSVADIKEIFE